MSDAWAPSRNSLCAEVNALPERGISLLPGARPALSQHPASTASSFMWGRAVTISSSSITFFFLNYILSERFLKNLVTPLQFFFKILFIYLFIYLWLLLSLRFWARALSSCGKRGPLFIAESGPLTIAASLVAEHRLQTRRLSSCGSRA